VRSTSLKDKLLRLQSLAGGNVTTAETSSQPVVHSLSDLVKAKLWRIVQKGVFKEDAGADLKPLTVPAGSVSELVDDDELDGLGALASLQDPAPPRYSQHDDLAGHLIRSPQLIGNLNQPYHEGWDGGLLAQPVNVHDILAQLEGKQYTKGTTNRDVQDISSLLSDDDDDDNGLLSSEANADDAIISEGEEISSVIGSHKDDGSVLSDSSFDSFLLDDNIYDDDETPQTSQDSAVSCWMAGRTVDEHGGVQQQPLPSRPVWQPTQHDTVDCGVRTQLIDDDFLISDVDVDDEDDEMLDDWADDYDMLED